MQHAPFSFICSPELQGTLALRQAYACAGELQEGPAGSFGTFLDSSIEPLLQASENNSQALHSRQEISDEGTDRPNAPNIFLLNCMLAIWSPLSLHRSCAQHVAKIRERIDIQVQPSLTDHQAHDGNGLYANLLQAMNDDE